MAKTLLVLQTFWIIGVATRTNPDDMPTSKLTLNYF